MGVLPRRNAFILKQPERKYAFLHGPLWGGRDAKCGLLDVFEGRMSNNMCFTRVVSEYFTNGPSMNCDFCILLGVFEGHMSNDMHFYTVP